MRMLLNAIRTLGCSTLCLWVVSFLASPASAAVESDVVGCAQVKYDNPGYNLVSFPLLALGSEEDSISVKDISGVLSQSNVPGAADQIMVLNPTTKQYTNYIYTTRGWVKKGEAVETTDVIPSGASVFIYVRSTTTLTQTGRVATEKLKEVTVQPGLNLVANPYPAKVKIASINGMGLTASNIAGAADKIWILNPETKAYSKYLFTKSKGWIKEGEKETTEDEIAPFEGFFYQKYSSEPGSLEFTRP